MNAFFSVNDIGVTSAQGLFELKDFETGRVSFPEQGTRSVNQVGLFSW